MAENGGFGVYFEHLYTRVNGVGNRDAGIRESSSAIPTVVTHLDLSTNGPLTPEMSRHPQSTDLFLPWFNYTRRSRLRFRPEAEASTDVSADERFMKFIASQKAQHSTALANA